MAAFYRALYAEEEGNEHRITGSWFSQEADRLSDRRRTCPGNTMMDEVMPVGKIPENVQRVMAQLEADYTVERLVPENKDWNDDLTTVREQKCEVNTLCQSFG